MPAAIVSNGTRDLFASHREPAWHGLGHVFDHEVTESGTMLDLAGLSNWNLRQIPAIMPEGVDRFISQPVHTIATIGDESVVLGTSGERYTLISNEDAFAFLQTLHDGSRWETAGAIKGGRVVFGSMAFDRDFTLDPTGVADVVKSYLLVYTSHDGSTGLAGGVTPTRVVCQNTLNVAMGNIKQTFKMRHTQSAAERMKAEAALWRQANTHMDAFESEAQRLYAASVTDREYFGIVENLFPKPEADVKGALKKWENRQGLFAQAWNGAPNVGIKNTAWGVFNALTEANQWGRGVRKDGQENFFAAGAGFDIPTNTFRQKALSMAQSLV